MPIISKIGNRSIKVRLVYGAMYFVLITGAITMLYPLMLMLSGSVKSQADIMNISPWPTYWFDDLALFQKYVESKYNVDIFDIEQTFHENIPSYSKIARPTGSDSETLTAYLAWREQCSLWTLGHARGASMLPENGRAFRNVLYQRFNGDLHAFNTEMAKPLKSWSDVWAPEQGVFRYPRVRKGFVKAFRNFAEKQPIRDRIISNLDGRFWKKYLIPEYTRDIEVYNRKHGTNYATYDNIRLSRYVPKKGLQRKDWEVFVREILQFQFIRLSPSLEKQFQQFLAGGEQYAGDIGHYNIKFGRSYTSFDDVPLPESFPDDRAAAIDWSKFIENREACPAEGIEVHGPRQEFEEYIAKQRGVSVEEISPFFLPLAAADWYDCMSHKGHYRWELTTRNYKQVFDYLLLHGKGIQNTVIYCVLAIGLALLVNPVAAYALSRYKPPSQYKILLLCMATMAFPAAVTMIPAFLLLKRFPLWSLAGGIVGFALAFWLLGKLFKKLGEWVHFILALVIGISVGIWLVPIVTLGKPSISLLNTFAALVLPGMANGYSIFLLKGFFDSLPRELYEAADIDGANEWTKFWAFTMNLSKPILAVIALGAFTTAYSQFMMALIIIPDQDMWTMMVWIFQLQSNTHQSVVNASLVIGAVPTFLIFLFCQGIIMRGIIVPTEK
jgi:multiple sugar transport system permease protein